MIRKTIETEGRRCILMAEGSPECLLIQPIDEQDLDSIEQEYGLIKRLCGTDAALAAFSVSDWNSDLPPWDAEAVFAGRGFGHGAGETLSFMEDRLLPRILAELSSGGDIPLILGGYSLAGLFALWAAYESGRFTAVSAASPSVWYPGWLDYAKTRAPKAGYIYLSLGRKEEKTANRTMAAVGDCIRAQHELLGPQRSILEWNEGNHFKDPQLRCAKGFAWCVKQLKIPGTDPGTDIDQIK